MPEILTDTEGLEEIELTITSDGTVRGTKIIDLKTGKVLFRVAELKYHVRAGELYATAEVIFKKPKLNLTAKFKVVKQISS